MPRLFTALELPHEIAMQLNFLQAGLPGARWIDRENLHLTLCFVGDVEREMARELAYELEAVTTAPFEMRLTGLDCFGNSKPHSLFAKVARNPALMELQASHERICQRLRLPLDKRRFTPHVTIARLRGVKPTAIANWLSTRGGFNTLPFEMNSFSLLSSRASVGGGPYVREEVYRLVRQAPMAVA